MKKYINKNLAKKLIIVGGLLVALSIVLAIISLLNAYEQAGDTFNSNSEQSLKTSTLLANVAIFSRNTGIVACLAGVIIDHIARPREK